MSRRHPSPPIWRAALLPPLLLNGGNGEAVDLGSWARHTRQHGEWTSLDFRHPVTGQFIAARAGTEDPQTHTTLTLTAAPVQNCGAELVIVHQAGAPASRGTDEPTQVGFRLNGLSPSQFRARLVIPVGDSFVFAQLLDEPPLDALRNHGSLTVDLPAIGPASFSLDGFESAWNTAQETCQMFLAP